MDYDYNENDYNEEEYDYDEEYTQIDEPNQLFEGKEDLESDEDQDDPEEDPDDDKERLDLLDAETEFDPTIAREEVEMKDAYADLSRAAFQGNVFQINIGTDIADLYHKISRSSDAQEQPLVIMEMLYGVYVEVLGRQKELRPLPALDFYTHYAARVKRLARKSIPLYLLGYLCLDPKSKKPVKDRFETVYQQAAKPQNIPQSDLLRYARYWSLVLLVN